MPRGLLPRLALVSGLLALTVGDVSAQITRRLRIHLTAATVPTSGQFTISNLHYQGAFRIADVMGVGNYAGIGGDGVMAYWPAHNSLLIVGYLGGNVREIGEIPLNGVTPVNGTLSSLPVVTPTQSADLLAGKRDTIDGDHGSGTKIGGIMPLDDTHMVISVYPYYDAGAPNPCGLPPLTTCRATLSHFYTTIPGGVFSAVTASNVIGPVRVGNGFQYLEPLDTYRIAGFVSGYMEKLPSNWAAAFGATHLTGNGGGISIVNRTSNGPSATAFNAADVAKGTTVSVIANKPLMGYPADDGAFPTLDHPALGRWNNGAYPLQGSPYWYNGNAVYRGMHVPTGYDSVIYIGYGGFSYNPPAYNNVGSCYGGFTMDPAQHFVTMPTDPAHHFCFDPLDFEGGFSLGMRPYQAGGVSPSAEMLIFNINDFLQVKDGAIAQPWDVRPNANVKIPMGSFPQIRTTPFCRWTSGYPAGLDVTVNIISGSAHDPVGKRIWLALAGAELEAGCINRPIILWYTYD